MKMTKRKGKYIDIVRCLTPIEKQKVPLKNAGGFWLIFTLFISLRALSGNYVQFQEGENDFLIGNWQGTVNAGLMKFTLVFKFIKSETGSLTGTLDIIEQSAYNLAVDEILVRGDSLYLYLPKINRKYAGKINSEKNEIDGLYIRNGAPSLALTLTKVDTVAALKRPQTPHPPYPYKEEEVKIVNRSDNVTLAGSITIPEGNGPFPAIILISGSGAQDRDETIFGHKPFKVLADFLTRNGFIVLRFDDRGAGGSSGDHLMATLQENSKDVNSAIDFLRKRKEVKKDEIILLGHSEGTIVASMAANENSIIAGIILLGAPGLRIDENLYLQNALIRKADGMDDETIARLKAMQQKIFTVVQEESNDSAARIKLQAIYSSNMYPALSADQKKAIDEKIINLLTPYFRDILQCDPYKILMKVKCPVLVIGGDKDLQCPTKQNLPVIEEALKLSKNRNYKIIEIPGLNHMLQTCTTGTISEYSTIEETIDPRALTAILEWLLVFNAR